MSARDLNVVAERLRSLLENPEEFQPVPVWELTHELGLKLIGSEVAGRYRLARWKKGECRIPQREIIVHASLLEMDDKEAELNEVIAHEISHFALHEPLTLQRPLPFGDMDATELDLGRMHFSREQRDSIEREATFVGALLQVPCRQLKLAVRPAIESYMKGDWTRFTSGVESAEKAAALAYSKEAVARTMSAFQVTKCTAKLALGYWSALARPPQAWIKEISEENRASSEQVWVGARTAREHV